MMKRCTDIFGELPKYQGYYLVEILTHLLVRFNKTREIFSSVIRVLSIFLTTAATSESVERVNSKERVPKVPCSIPAASYAEM